MWWGLSLDSWNNLIVVFLSIGAAAAVAVGITTYIAFQLQKQEAAEAKDEFDRYKLDADKKIAEAHARAAEANRVAEEERLARLKLEAKLAPRSVDKALLKADVSAFSGNRVDFIAFVQGTSPDTPLLSFAISEALNQAGWSIKGWTTLGANFVITGVLVTTRENSSPEIESAANALVAALVKQGVDASRWPQLNFNTGKLDEMHVAGVNGPPWDENDVAPIRVLIGTKP
jgi:hypothetical protein